MKDNKIKLIKIELCKLHYFYSIQNEFRTKIKNDSEKIMRFIESHPKFDAIYSAFMKGPDPQSGFMWTTTEWWSPEEGEAIKIVSNKVLDYDWDSSGYGYMMRIIESKIKALQVVDGVLVKDVENPEEEEKNSQKAINKQASAKLWMIIIKKRLMLWQKKEQMKRQTI